MRSRPFINILGRVYETSFETPCINGSLGHVQTAYEDIWALIHISILVLN
jgi:hypothetical protein